MGERSFKRRDLGKLAALAPAGLLATAAPLAAASPPATVGSLVLARPNPTPRVVPAVHGKGAHLVTLGRPHQRLLLRGVAVWGIKDYVTRGFAQTQYQYRDKICAKIAAWGGNHIRLRVLADEYVHLKQMKTKANYLKWVRDWVSSAKAHGLYTYISWWDSRDSSDGKVNNARWAKKYSFAFPMMKDVYHTLKLPNGSDDPFVFYEPFNEPSQVSWVQWQPAMRATVSLFRSLGYQGVLVIDTINFSHEYSELYMNALEVWDSKLTRTRRHNLVFARHDYCSDYVNAKFDPNFWRRATGLSQTRHVLLESEIGNANGSASNLAWSAAIGSYFHAKAYARPNIAGVTGFVWGNWYDTNAMSLDPVGDRPTPWGNIVRGFLHH